VEELNRKLQEATQTRDQLKRNYEVAFETHVSRIGKNTYIDKRENIFRVWREYIRKEKNAINVIGAIARKHMKTEVFSRIRLTAREKFLDLNADRVMSNFWRLFKQALVRGAFSKWRGVSYKGMVQTMNAKREELVLTQQNQANEMANMTLMKHKKAERILKQKRQREVSTAWIEMAKVIRALRVKQGVLEQNLQYGDLKKSVRKWFCRTQVTLYLRRRDEQVVRKYRLIQARKCFEAWQERTRIERLLCQRIVKFVKRMSYLDVAHGFQQIQHYQRSHVERIRERKEFGNQTIYNTLNRLLKHKLADALHTLKNRAAKRDFKEKFLHRAFKHSYLYRMKHYFQKWKHNKERQDLADMVNVSWWMKLVVD